MLLDVDVAIPYLVDHGYLSPAEVVAGGVRVTSASRRNRNLRVSRPDRPGYLLKQAEAQGSTTTLGTEATFYEMCWADGRAAPVRPFVARLCGREPADELLLIELLEHAVPLQQMTASFAHPGFLAAVGEAIGSVLGTCHKTFRVFKKYPEKYEGRFVKTPPWVLWVHRPGPEILADLSAANRKTLQILQGEAQLGRHLDALRRAWQVETLIHCDIKADNFLVVHPATNLADDAVAPEPPQPTDQVPHPLSLKLVDWELVQLGDPAWDLAGVLKDFVVYWISSMPIAAGMSGAELAAQAAWPLGGFQAAARRLWSSYVRAAGLDPRERSTAQLLVRAVHDSAAYLVQAAYESAQRASNLGNHEVMMLQVGANIFSDPAAATLQLYGIPMQVLP